MAFDSLPIFSPDYAAFVDMIKRSHESPQDYANMKHMIETSTLNSGEKSLLLRQLDEKFSS